MLNKRKPHILFMPSWYPTHDKDIRGCFFREQAIALKKHGYQIGVVTIELRSLKQWKTIFSTKHGVFYENDQGIDTIRFKGMFWFPKIPILTCKFSLYAGIRALEAYIQKNGYPELIHVHSCIYMGEVAYYAYKKYGIKYIVTEHSSGYFRNLYGKYLLTSTIKILQHSKKNIAVSLGMANFFNKNFITELDEWEVIPNIVNPLFFNNNVKRRDAEKFIFINVAFMNENKKQINIVKAFENLKNRGISNIELILVGDGVERKKIENYINDKKIGNIECVGLLSRDKVAKLMSQSDCFVLSSTFETFGVVVIEALACGLPVISTKCGGPEDIINESNGLLIEKNDIQALERGMLDIMNKKFDSLEIGNNCYNEYSEGAVVHKLEEVYRDVFEL